MVFIPKGTGGPEEAPSYRPICLIEALGKLYEILVRDRLVEELEEKAAIAEDQYGFRRGKSTVQAIQKALEIAGEIGT